MSEKLNPKKNAGIEKMLMAANEKIIQQYFSWDPQEDSEFAPLIVGKGSIGGKGRSLLFGIRKLWDQDEELATKVIFPPSIFLAVSNYQYVLAQIKDIGHLAEMESDEIERRFLETELPPAVISSIRIFLNKVKDPIIVRSSSMLEDSLKYSFAGKYLSTFLINDEDDLDLRVELVSRQIKKIYSRIFFPMAIAYREKHGLGSDQMGIIIMRVSGKWRGRYYYPTLAGVGFSKYYRRWTTRVKPEDGIIRLVFGMGTTSTKRGYARSFSLTMPSLRPEGQNPFNIMRHSQEHFQVVDKEKRELVTVHIKDIWKDIVPYHSCFPDYAQVYTSDFEGGYFRRMSKGSCSLDKDSKICFTFEEFASRSKHFFVRMKKILKILDESMGIAADIEFAYHPNEDLVELVQSRPLWVRENQQFMEIPDIDPAKIILKADRMVTDGQRKNIPYLIMIDHNLYCAARNWCDIARGIGNVNYRLGQKKFILVAPGRVGSSNPLLGVPVRYDEITNCCCIVELGIPKAGFMPELSFGTHFFTDLEIDEILYMPVYQGEEGNIFNERFFNNSPYALGSDPAIRIYAGSFSVYSNGEANIGIVTSDRVNKPI